MPPLSDETLKVRIKRMPSHEPPLKPHQRWALLATGGLVLGLAVYCATLLGGKPATQGAAVALTPAPPNVSRSREVPLAADGTPLIDLVCGAPVDDTAPYRTDHYGKTLYFAHAECLAEFRKKPEAYVKVKVNVKVKMLDGEQSEDSGENPVPEATAGGEESVPADEEVVTEEEAPVPEDTPPPPAADGPPPASEPPAATVPMPNPDGSVWKDASNQPVPPDDNSEPSWLPPDPNATPPQAPVQSVPADDSVPGWVPGSEPTIDSQPVP
ncbi:YHS domain-containing protein [bacterium CPR1]|nr:YHS domain-containing protein [bacterium CPR1]